MSEDSAQLKGGLCVERVVQIDWKWFHQARTVHYSGYWELFCFKDMKAKIYALPICRWLRKHFQGSEEGSSVPFQVSHFVTQLSPLGRKKTRKPRARCCILDCFFRFIPAKKYTLWHCLFVSWFLRLACQSFMLCEFFLHLMGPASHRHNNPSNQLRQLPGEIESVHSPH